MKCQHLGPTHQLSPAFWLLAFSLLFPSLAKSMDTLSISSDFKKADIQDWGHLYLEKKHEINFEKIVNLPENQFRPLLETGISFTSEPQVHWVKFYVKNNSGKSNGLILEVYNPRINRLQLFAENKNGEVEKSPLLGDDFPFQSRIIPHRNFLFPIHIPMGETVAYYMLADKYSENIRLRMAVYDEAYFAEIDRSETFWLSFFTGFLFCICVLVTLAALVIRWKILTYFLLYSWAVSLVVFGWLGFGFKYLWSNFPYFNSISGYFFIAIASMSMMALTRVFLETKKNLPWGDKALRAMQWVVAFHLPYLFFYRSFSGTIGHILIWSAQFVQFAYMAIIVTVTILVYRKSKKKDHLAFLFAFLFVLTSSVVQILQNIDLVDSNFLIEYAILGGFLLDILALTFIIGQQLRFTFLENIKLNLSLQEIKMEAATALIAGQMEERKRLSMELHDGVSLRLATIKMRLSKLGGETGGLLSDVGKVASDIRSFSHALSPVDFEQTTLQDALEDLAHEVENGATGLQVKCHCEVPVGQLQGFAAQAVYLSARELLANVVKHAEATQAELRLVLENENCLLSVADNGAGFAEGENKVGIGLKNLRARAALLNGELRVEPLSQGVKVTLAFPLN